MAKTVIDVARALRLEPGDETEQHAELLHDGRWLHVDFGEEDQVFPVSVQRIFGRWLTLPPESTVGRIDGTVITVHSVAIANPRAAAVRSPADRRLEPRTLPRRGGIDVSAVRPFEKVLGQRTGGLDVEDNGGNLASS